MIGFLNFWSALRFIEAACGKLLKAKEIQTQ